jgi:hypothetical protein
MILKRILKGWNRAEMFCLAKDSYQGMASAMPLALEDEGVP